MSPETFSSLISNKELLETLSKLNLITPTEVQALAIPSALEGQDLIVQAQTGSGKTIAFMLPIISKIREEKQKKFTLALIITPTRELATQVATVVESLAPDIVPSCLIGGASSRQQERQLRDDPRIVIGTPGRILDFIRQRILNLRSCSTFVLDEADEMLSMGFLDDVRDILRKLPPKRQGMFFSATISGRVLTLASSFLKKPKTITVAVDTAKLPLIEHLYFKADGGLTGKAEAICRIFQNFPEESAIIFCNTKSDTSFLEVYLKRRGFNAQKINSDLTQRERDRVLTSLRDGELRYLIATDVAARGIDIKELEIVINYTLPKEHEVYVHRSGRTGRAGAKGKAICIIGPQDIANLYMLNRHCEDEFKELILPPSKDIVAA